MGDWRRHAIFFAPPSGSALARFGADWLGWDPEAGAATDGFDVPSLPLPRAELTETPRRYGFHATLKAPFRLASGRGVADLDTAAAKVAASCTGFTLRLAVEEIGRFLALVPLAPPAALAALEAACVTELDSFRAPAPPEETARRLAAGLDPTERVNLARWGYPYVLERFRFHMTLTRSLPPDLRSPVRDSLCTVLQPLVSAPISVHEICRFAEAADGRFHLAARYPLKPAPSGRVPAQGQRPS